MKNFTQKFIGLLALVFAMSFNANSQDLPRRNEIRPSFNIFY